MSASISKEKLLLLKKELSRMPEGSLNIKKCRGRYDFYHYVNSRQVFINRDSDLIYRLARKMFLYRLINNKDTRKFVEKCVAAGLNPQRITLSQAQYRWINSDYPKNTGWSEDLKYTTHSGIAMRSKSERDIGNELEYYAVPFRYEMIFKVDVSGIVSGLREYLAAKPNWNYDPRSLFSYEMGKCRWNVPEELQWMNSAGSIWRSFDSRTETVTLSVDFAILLGDGSILLWEHAGLCLNPVYRCNTSERIFVLHASNYAKSENVLFTTEEDILDLSNIDEIIESKILPRL